jgi:single-strand DNA-binding protein
MAESCQKNCEKGRGIRVVGRLKQSRWTNSEGKTASRISIIAEHVEFKKRLTSEITENSSETAGTSEEKLEAMKEANQAAVSDEIQEQIPEEAIAF